MKTSELYKLILDLYHKHGGFPPIWLIVKESQCNEEFIKKSLDYLVSRNKLIFKNDMYWFPEQISSKNKIKTTYNKNRFSMILICRIIMGIVGISCIACSIKFTYSFNKLNMPVFWGFVLSASIAIFTSFCFTIREYLKQYKRRFQANIFIILYLMGVSYSIFTAVAGQYNDYLINNQKTIENKMIKQTNGRRFELLSEQKNRLVNQIESYRSQLISQQKIIDNLSESPERKFEYNNTWKQANNLISELQDKILELENKISEIDSQLISSVNVESNSDKNIFDWISDLLKISSGLLQFFISLFPAIFIDLVSPFAIMFAFYKDIKRK